jgi:transcriptional regulator with XRE-family HTH domain
MMFPQRIAAIRKELKLSQEKFGELANVSQRTIAFWESGERMPSHTTISTLADRLDVSVDYLLGRTENAKNNKSPTADGDGTRLEIINRIQQLPDPALVRLSDFLTGLEAGQEISSPAAAAPDPSEALAE